MAQFEACERRDDYVIVLDMITACTSLMITLDTQQVTQTLSPRDRELAKATRHKLATLRTKLRIYQRHRHQHYPNERLATQHLGRTPPSEPSIEHGDADALLAKVEAHAANPSRVDVAVRLATMLQSLAAPLVGGTFRTT